MIFSVSFRCLFLNFGLSKNVAQFVNHILHLCHTFTLKSFAMTRCDAIKIRLFPTITSAKKRLRRNTVKDKTRHNEQKPRYIPGLANRDISTGETRNPIWRSKIARLWLLSLSGSHLCASLFIASHASKTRKHARVYLFPYRGTAGIHRESRHAATTWLAGANPCP